MDDEQFVGVDPEYLEEFQVLGKRPGVTENDFKIKYLGEDHAVVYKRRHIHFEQHYHHAYHFILDYITWANN